MRPDGTSPRLLTGTAARAKRGSISPDGRRVVFDGEPRRGDTFAFDIQVVGLDGRGRRRLTHGAARDIGAHWSPDGRAILFQRQLREFGAWSLWRVGADGSGLSRIGPGLAASLSPDGRSILFAREQGQAGGQADVFVMQVDGSGLRRLTRSPDDEVPAGWSPDGRSILFTVFSGARPQSDVYVMRADGSRKRRLTHGRGFRVAAAWSPDGRRILFTTVIRLPNGERGQVWVMDADGANGHDLSRNRFDDNATSWARVAG